MSDDEKTSKERQSLLDESLETQPTTDMSIFSSTVNQDENTGVVIDPYRRRTMGPSQLRIQNEENLVEINSQCESSEVNKKFSEKELQNKPHTRSIVRFDVDVNTYNSRINDSNIKLVFHKGTQTEFDNSNKQVAHQKSESLNSKRQINNNQTVEHVEIESETTDDDFDAFILKNFVPYSGKENVHKWLATTETKFNDHCIGRNLRFTAISLLVEGEAKRIYIKHRHEIRSFDDFYAFLSFEFDHTDDTTSSNNNFRTNNNQTSSLTVSSQLKSMIEPNQSHLNNSKTLNMTDQEPLLSSTKTVPDGITTSMSEKPVINKSLGFDSSSTSLIDPTLIDLRKAIIGDFIKNPKTFKGGKDDVKKWMEDIEHLFGIAHIADSTRLDLISYALRGDALEWFKHNKTSFHSWDVFVSEVKRAFTSSFYEELAFKKLEAYSQGENQSISSFYHDVLKLCQEADSKMTEATKLKNLLSKTKRSIQFEVRKKKPTSLKEYLEFAKEAEELIQLSNMSSDVVDSSSITQPIYHQSKVSFSSAKTVPWNQPQNRPSNNNSSRYYRNFNRNNTFPNNSNAFSNHHYSSFPNERTSQGDFRSNYNSSDSYPQRPNSQFTVQNNNNNQSPRNTPSHNTRDSTRRANTIDIDATHPLTNTPVSQESFSHDNNSQCDQFKQGTSVLPNF